MLENGKHLKNSKHVLANSTMKEIYLRKFDIDKDLPFFHKVHSDAKSMQFYGMNEFKTLEESRNLMNSYIESEFGNKSMHRVICDTDSGEYLGEIGLFNINTSHHRANAYCILMPETRKQGVSISASSLFYREVFAKLHLNRVQALVDSRNINASKSLVGIGFNYEGKLIEYEYFDGQYIDIEVFALTKKRFLELYGV